MNPQILFESSAFVDFYVKHLRDNLFTGFLTVATFLFAVHSFLIITLQKDVYSDARYKKFKLQAKKEGLTKDTPAGPLKRLSKRLTSATVLAFVTALVQISLGLMPYNLTASLACAISIWSLVDLGRTLWIQKEVMADWLESLDAYPDAA